MLLKHVFIFLVNLLEKLIQLSSMPAGQDAKSTVKTWIYVIVLMVPIFVPIALLESITFRKKNFTNSGWEQLSTHYNNSTPIEYQDNTYRLGLIRKGYQDTPYTFHTKIMLNEDGLYFAAPHQYYSRGVKNAKPTNYPPLHIPWNAITQCIQTDTKVITMPVKDTDVSLQLALWDFLSPLCEEKNIPTIYEKQKDTAPQ